MLHAACPLQPSSRQGDARKLASSSSTKFCTGSLPLTLHQEETVIFFFQRKFLLSKLYFNSSFYDSLRMKHHMCSISRLSWGKTRGIAIWRNYFALWRALSLSLTIIFIHIPRIFSFREERERVKNNWRNNKIISIRAHTRFVKVQRL